MEQTHHSIRARFTRYSVLFLALVIALGVVSFWRLRDYNRASGEIQERYLPSTRYLGDINNYTSDFRANEATSLLAALPEQIRECLQQESDLDNRIVEAQQAYGAISHDPVEAELYSQFSKQWRDYRGVADDVIHLSTGSHNAEAINTYLSKSLSLYNKASNTLEVLTQHNVTEAEAAVRIADRAFFEAMVLIGLVAGGGAILILVNAGYIRRSISDPLVSLAASMHRLAGNQMDIGISDIHRADEIGEMARALVVFRDNAIELARNQRVLAEQASMLGEKLAYEQKMTEAQRNFISMASHEFRTPLTIIDGYAQRLVRMADHAQPEQLAEHGRKIRAAVVRLTTVIDNLLESGRLLDGGADLYIHPTLIDIIDILKDVCRLHREITPSVTIVEHFPGEAVVVTGDGKLLFQAFSNLVSNGIKYSPKAAVLDVLVERSEGVVEIRIRDRGIGIASVDIPNLFARYFRGKNTGGIVGTGVGLFLVKTVVEMHHGRVSVQSELGEGSTFTISFPI